MSLELDDGFVVDEPCDGFVSPLPDDSEPEGFVGVAGVVLAGLSAGEPLFVELDGLLGVTGLSVPLDGLSLCAGLFAPLPDDSEPEGLTGVDGVVLVEPLGLPCELSFDVVGFVFTEPLPLADGSCPVGCLSGVVVLPDELEPDGLLGVDGVVLPGLLCESDGLFPELLVVELDGLVVELPLCAGLFTTLPDDSEPEGLTGVDGVVSPGLFCELFDGLSVELLEPLIDCPLLLVLLSLLPEFCVCVVSVFAFIFFV